MGGFVERFASLRVRAALHGRSTEAEIRDILESTVRPAERLRVGTTLRDIARSAGLGDQEIDSIESARDRTPAQPLRFE